MSGIIYVLTTPRPRGISYLAQTIAMVEASASWPRVLVVDDTRAPTRDDRGVAFPVAPSTWETILAARPGAAPSNKSAWLAALAHARAHDAAALVLEDDIQGCTNAVAAMERAPFRGATWLSFFRVGGDLGTPYGYLRAPGKDFVGAQAVRFEAQALRMFDLDHLNVRARVAASPRAHAAEALAEIAAAEGWTYDLAFPHVVQHVGDVSAVDPARAPGPNIRSRAFVGLSTDALSTVLPAWQAIA